MSVVANDWPEYVRMITKLTKEDKLSWKQTRAFPREFQADFENRHLNLQERKEPNFGVFAAAGELSLVDDAGNRLFTFPDVPNINDLLAAINDKVVDISDFLSKLKAASGSAI